MTAFRCTCASRNILATSDDPGEVWMVRQQRSVHFQGAGTFTIACERCTQRWDLLVPTEGTVSMSPYRHLAKLR